MTMTPPTLDDRRWSAMRAKSLDHAAPFVIAVTTTGIYCRVGCPARSPHPQNVSFFDTVGEARTAGYRACKRCHPDHGDLSPWRPKSRPRPTHDRPQL